MFNGRVLAYLSAYLSKKGCLTMFCHLLNQIWMEDLRTPILSSRYDGAYLTNGCWSPTRPGVLFTTKIDGTLDIWDLLYKQNDPIFSTKVVRPLIQRHRCGCIITISYSCTSISTGRPGAFIDPRSFTGPTGGIGCSRRNNNHLGDRELTGRNSAW